MMAEWNWNAPVWKLEKNRARCSCWGCRRYGFPGEIERYYARYPGCPKDFERDEPRTLTKKQSGSWRKPKPYRSKRAANGMTLEELRSMITAKAA